MALVMPSTAAMARQETPLDASLWAFLGQLNQLLGLLFVLRQSLKKVEQEIQTLLSSTPPQRFVLGLGSVLSVGDITAYPSKRLYRTYTATVWEAIDETYLTAIHTMMARHSAWTVAQAYEAFETFVNDIAEGFVHALPTTTRPVTRRRRRRQQTKKVLDRLRSEAPQIGEWEQANSRGLDLRQWYDVVGEVRHAITHSDEVIPARVLRGFSSERRTLLRQCFPGMEAGESYSLRLDVEDATRALRIFGDYAFVVFKALCIQQGYDWNILVTMLRTSS